MKALLKEPFVQFLLLGGFLFCLYFAFGQPSEDEEVPPILVDDAFVSSIRSAWKAKRLREPTEEELRSEVENRLEKSIAFGRKLAYLYWIGIGTVAFLGATKPF